MATAFSLTGFISAPPLRRARAVAKGLPVAALRELLTDPTIGIADVAHIVAPRRTLDRRLKDGGNLTPEESDRLARLLDILALATKVFGGRAAAMAWLDAPKRRFEGQRPLALLDTDSGTRLVEAVLMQAMHGFAA